MITQERKDQLRAAGYKTEDMRAVWGKQFHGQFRWLNNRHEGDGFGNVQYGVEDAWFDAHQFEARYGY